IVLLSAVAFMFMTRNEMWMNTTTVTWSDVAWSESPVEPPVEVTSDIIHNIDQVIIFEDLTVTLNSIIFRRGGIFEDAGDGMQYVALGLTIQNASNEVNDFHSWGVRVYADNIRMQSAARGERYLGGVISGASLATGITVIRYSGFLIPLDIAELIIEIPSTSRDRELAIITVPVFGSGEQIGDVSVH
ncbi:MAG: hypothetical protein FWB98_04270, partial [Defluviitaleaceae bacterium]|nr:hypothetical protein [Defluviitaleaceae bacterium]